MSKNCPNCGAVYELDKNECPFCGTLYYDLTAIDFTQRKPIFIKMKVPMNWNGGSYAEVTQCAIPVIDTIEYSTNTTDYTDRYGSVVSKVCTGHSVTTNIHFDAVVSPDGSMMQVREFGNE